MTKSFLSTLFCIIFNYSNAQNLVPNPSFESTQTSDSLPKSFCEDEAVFNGAIEAWQTVHSTTPDFLHPEFENLVAVGKPIDGQSMIGLFNVSTWYENVTSELITPLEKGKTYYAEFWIVRSKKRFHPYASQEQFISSSFGLLFSEEPLKSEKRIKPIIGQPQVTCPERLWLTTNWEKVTGLFTADKAYKYVTVGHFKNENDPKPEVISGYLLLDNIKVEALADFNQVTNLSSLPDLNIALPLSEIYFEVGQANLLDSSIPMLEEIEKFLLDNPKIIIKINGHTDNIGSESTNLELSENRAKAIVNYLKEKGIDEYRMTSKGYGESKPKYSNDTEEGRKENRRVEIELYKSTN